MALRPPKKLSTDELARYAATLLSARAMSATELRSKLRRKAENQEDVEPLLSSLAEYGAVDDRKFAGQFAETRASGGRFGKSRVLADLMARRVAPDTARLAVDQAFESVNEEESIRLWLDRKYRRQNLAGLLESPAKFAAVYRRLRTAGFGAGPALKVLQRIRVQPIEIAELEDDQA